MEKKKSVLSVNELKEVTGGHGTPLPEDYQSKFPRVRNQLLSKLMGKIL